MAFRRSDLQEAFFVPGTYAFRVYGYGTTDALEEVLAPGYFAHGSGLLRPGDLIYVSMGAPESRGAVAPRKALVMMRADGQNPARAAGTVRLVQDFGRPSDGALDAGAPSDAVAPPTPPKRGRGRPPGSKNRKAGVMAGDPDVPSEARA